MISSAYLRTPTRLLALFVVLGGLPLAALGWLTWRFLDQDRALEGQRIRERLENDASLLARESDRALAAWEDLLTASAPNVPATLRAEGVFLAFNQKGILRREGVASPITHWSIPALKRPRRFSPPPKPSSFAKARSQAPLRYIAKSLPPGTGRNAPQPSCGSPDAFANRISSRMRYSHHGGIVLELTAGPNSTNGRSRAQSGSAQS